jgi:nicotinamidase-related amidase
MDRALVVIDIQNDYFPGGTFPLHQAEKVEGQIATAIAKAKAAGDRVILVRHVSNAKTGLFEPDRGGIAIRPAMLAASGDTPVVTKHFADAFQETNL